MKPYETALYCSYVSLAFTANNPVAGRAALVFQSNSSIPNKDYFYTMAQCDWNDDGGSVDSLYMMRSDSDGMAVHNEGS